MARWPWCALGGLVLLQIPYPLTHSSGRAALVVVTVLWGCALSVAHAVATRGGRVGVALVAVTAAGGLLVEALGLATGFPFGSYVYGDGLGPTGLGVPLVVPLAWTWMAWPSWLAAARLVSRPLARIGLAGLALAAWDLFLDPQMVAAGYWRWAAGGVPATNYLGWLGVAVAMMAALAPLTGSDVDLGRDAPMLALYLWTYASSALAHAVFLHLPASALRGALGMGVVAVPLAWRIRP